MIVRALSLAAGLAGGTAVAQFPEFSQQYLQRLSGAVDELETVVADFDRSADRAGLSREAALQELSGTVFLDGRQVDMSRTISRYERLKEERLALANSTAITRLFAAPRVADEEIARRTWEDYKPAIPTTAEGLGFAAAGFLAGFFALRWTLGLILIPFRGRRRA